LRKNIFVSIIVVLSILLLSACGDDKEEEATEDGEEMELPEPSVDDVPDVVAEVNGEEILKDEFVDTYTSLFMNEAMQAQLSGAEVDEEELKLNVVEGMIGNELLTQKAEEKGYEAEDEDVDEILDNLVEQNGLETTEDLFSALEEQGLDEEEVRSQLSMQVKIDKLIAEETGDFKPSEEELMAAYEQMKEQQAQMAEGEDVDEEEFPSFDEMKDDLTSQLVSQKENEVAEELIEELRDDADITIHL